MYRLKKFEKFTFKHVVFGSMLLYCHFQLIQFRQFSAMLTACDFAKDKVRFCQYVLNEWGEEYYKGIPMNKSHQSNKETENKPTMTPLEKGAPKRSKKESPTSFGNILAIKLRCSSEQASVCS